MSRPRDVEVTVPPGWVPIDLDPARTEASVAALLEARCRGIDGLEPLRAELQAAMVAAAAEARDSGGIQLWLSVEPVGELPLPASLLIAVVPPAEGPERGADMFVSDVMAAVRTARRARGGESEPVELRLGRGLRSRARRTSVPNVEPDLSSTTVQFDVPIPGRDMMLLMTFNTPVPQGDLEDAFVELFDAIAAGARWVR